MEVTVVVIATYPSCCGSLLPAFPHHRTDVIPRTMVPGCFDQEPAGVGIAGLGDRPCTRDVPEEYSLGTNPNKRANTVCS